VNKFLACPLLVLAPCLSAQNVLFDFDNAPPYTPLPINVTAQGVTAHLSATGAGYSIQSISAVPVVPLGFTGNIVYPSSVFAADLLISFTRTLTAFSIQYSPQELGCDDSARMRVTAFRGSVQVGTNTHTAQNPGTWPVDTLACAFPQGFDNVVIHYDAPPPTCHDYGVIFICDNMNITLAPAGAFTMAGPGCAGSLPASTLVANEVPRIGTLLQVTVDHLPLDAAFLFTGYSNTVSAFGPLPLDASVLGMPGCTGYASIDAVNFLNGSGGAAVFSLNVPHSLALVGMRVWQQALVPDPAAGNPLQAVLSDAAALLIGQ